MIPLVDLFRRHFRVVRSREMDAFRREQASPSNDGWFSGPADRRSEQARLAPKGWQKQGESLWRIVAHIRRSPVAQVLPVYELSAVRNGPVLFANAPGQHRPRVYRACWDSTVWRCSISCAGLVVAQTGLRERLDFSADTSSSGELAGMTRPRAAK